METRNIKMIDGTDYVINLETPELEKHFNGWNNYTKEILEHFNSKNYYEDFVNQEDKNILDLGANVGLFALYVAPWAEKIVCVEPTPSHFNLLESLTKNFNNIDCIPAAVSNMTGAITFYDSPTNTTMNSLIPRDGGSFQVDGYKLSDLVEKTGFDKVHFIKMDIEGSEYTVLDEETISYIGENIPKILIEFHGDPRNTKYANIYDHINKTIPDYIELFKNMGYEVNHFNWDSIFCHKK